MSGEPYTSRGVRTVRRGVFENLSLKDEKASGTYLTIILMLKRYLNTLQI